MKKIIIILTCLILSLSTINIKGSTIKNYYPNIWINVPIIDQEPQGCAIASMASIEAYYYGEKSQDYTTSKVYAQVKRQNQGGILAYWYRIGYEPKNVATEAEYLQALYEQLASGFPVIVFRNSTHYSVCYGYEGSKDKLEMEGFMVADVAKGVEKKVDLKTWIGKYKPTYTTGYDYVVRKQGLNDASMLVSDITFAINHPSKMDEINTGVFVYGNIVSNKTLNNIHVKVFNKDNKIAFEVNKKIATLNYNVANLDNDLAFRTLPKGYYTYQITVTDKEGYSKTYAFQFFKTDQVYHFVKSYTLLHDLQVNQWYYDVANDAYTLNIMSGVQENIFGGDLNMSRGMVACVLYRMHKVENYPYRYVFWDVANHYYGSATTWASDHDIVNGYPDGSFHPDENVTREQLVVMIRNYANFIGVPTNSKQSLKSFHDYKQVSDYAQSAMKWAVENNLISGNADGLLKPQNFATRAEAAKIFVQFYHLINKGE